MIRLESAIPYLGIKRKKKSLLDASCENIDPAFVNS